MSLDFCALGLTARLVDVVQEMGYEEPTPIQEQAIPLLLTGQDMIGQAQTGTGKTAAFILPIIQNIKPGSKEIQALVLAPTRELAIQVCQAANRMASHSGLKTLAIYGGQSYTIQTRQLEKGVDLVVGTPGRLIDLINQGKLDLKHVRMMVLDEADEMLDMGFIEDVETILKQVPQERQIALFSATMPEAVRELAKRYLKEPAKVHINPTQRTAVDTEQRYYYVRENDKLAVLMRLLQLEEIKSALIFARTKARTQELADELNRRGYPAESLHGDLNQARRESVLSRFRSGSVTVLVATDVAARGLDIDDISHVFNYDIPQDSEDYIHRIGRTGRAGRKGRAITFVTPRERRLFGIIEKAVRQSVQACQIPTREEIQARRDTLFLERLAATIVDMETHQNTTGSSEYNLLKMLKNGQVDVNKIAAAAIRLARKDEPEIGLEEIVEPAAESKKERLRRQDVIREKAKNSMQGYKSNAREKSSGKKDGKTPFKSGKKHSHEQGMVRLTMNLGIDHGIRPGDIVGAIASETGIPGRAIGQINMRRDHTFVDIAEKHVVQVLNGSTGQYSLRGKPVLLELTKN